MRPADPATTDAPTTRPLSEEDRALGLVDLRAFGLGGPDVAVPPVVLITYDVEVFDTTAFARVGLDRPENIGRSVTRRQAEFFMGRLAAREALVHLATAGQVGIGASRQPIWPAGVIGSISHAGRYAAAVATRDGGITGVGIDIEHRIGTQTRASVEDSVLTPAEQSRLHPLAGDVPYEMLLTIAFSAKESFFKGSFATVGTYFDFDAVELTALDVAAGTLQIVLTRTLAPSLPQGRRFTLRHGFIDEDTVLTRFVW
jgi:4'-phosphopantetheinyl transferase EntD